MKTHKKSAHLRSKNKNKMIKHDTIFMFKGKKKRV